jgi:hypothetical protein
MSTTTSSLPNSLEIYPGAFDVGVDADDLRAGLAECMRGLAADAAATAHYGTDLPGERHALQVGRDGLGIEIFGHRNVSMRGSKPPYGPDCGTPTEGSQ